MATINTSEEINALQRKLVEQVKVLYFEVLARDAIIEARDARIRALEQQIAEMQAQPEEAEIIPPEMAGNATAKPH